MLFGDEKLKRTCATRDALERRYGSLAAVLARRLTSLRAATVLTDLRNVPGRFEPLRANRAGQFSMRLDAHMRLVFEAADDPLPLLSSGGLDHTRVARVRILEVADYHDD